MRALSSVCIHACTRARCLESKRAGETARHGHTNTDRQSNRQAGRQTDRKTDRETVRDSKTDGQIIRQG